MSKWKVGVLFCLALACALSPTFRAGADTGGESFASSSRMSGPGVDGGDKDASRSPAGIDGVVQPDASNNEDTVGVYRPETSQFFLRNSNTSGFADISFTFGIPGDLPVVGDWDGDGVDTVGVFRDGVFFLRNSNSAGFADLVVPFGQEGDLPVVGDWDADGIDSIGVYRGDTFMLRKSNTPGEPQIIIVLGVSGDVPIAGDWNNDRLDTVGIYRPSDGLVVLKDGDAGGGFQDVIFTYGAPGDKPLGGDWNADGANTIGVYRDDIFLLRNFNGNGFAEIVFQFGILGDLPLSGDWDGLPAPAPAALPNGSPQ
ncbi:MAG TPA: hypothetical protein VE262_05915 [Blastocatellia bacterium]|nr:hypothetical protein [Blastocatellia bacterium]